MLDIARIQAITLDLDDTLWPIWPTIAEAELRLQQWLQVPAPATAQLFASAPARHALRLQVELDWPDRQHDLSWMRTEMIRLGLQRCQEDPALALPAFEVFFAARHAVSLYEDALPALQRLAQRWPVLALSNGNADVTRIGLGDYFCASVSAREVGVAKPDGRVFAAAAQRLGLQPGQILHVGDDVALDVVGALQAGMQAVWVNRSAQLWPLSDVPAVTSVADMAALCDLLG